MHKKLSEKARSHNPLLGLGFGLFAFFLLAVMNGFAKLLFDYIDPVANAFYRNLIGVIILGGFFLLSRQTQFFVSKQPKGQLLRGTVGILSLVLTFTAFSLLSMSQTTVLLFSSSLILPILGVLILKERVGIYRWSAIIIGFIGVIIAAQPDVNIPILGVVFALAAASCHAVIGICLRWLGKTEEAMTTTFYFMLIGLFWLIPFMFFIDLTFPLEKAWLVLAMAVSGTAAQVCLASAYRYIESSMVAPLNYTGLLWAVLFDLSIWGIVPASHVLLGGLIIIGSNLFIWYRERQISFEK